MDWSQRLFRDWGFAFLSYALSIGLNGTHSTHMQTGSHIVNNDLIRHIINVMPEHIKPRFWTWHLEYCTDLAELVQRLLKAGIEIYCPRDLTCGTLARVLIKLAMATGQRFGINKTALFVYADIQSANRRSTSFLAQSSLRPTGLPHKSGKMHAYTKGLATLKSLLNISCVPKWRTIA